MTEQHEIRWLLNNPDFAERPASIREFVGPGYLELQDNIRPGVMEALVAVFGDVVSANSISIKRKSVFSGAIGVGKSTYASIAMCYMVHWTYCLKDPQKFFGLMPGSRIAFMLMSTSERQAKEVLFGDIKARIEHSPWFQQYCQYDRNIKNQFRFDKDLWIIPGGSEETRFEGYNVLCGVIDEGDSHKQTDRKDYAEEGFNTLYSRIDSRFPDMANDTHRGLLMVIGQMKSATGFMNKIFKEFADDKDGSSYRLTIWESFGWNRYTENPKDAETGRETAPRKSFVYDVQRKKVLSTSDAVELGVDFVTPESGYIEVPTTYLTAFRRNPVKALRDLAGIPPQATDPFISLTERVDMCQELWHQRYGDQSPVTDSPSNPQFQPWFKAPDQIKRVAHIDIATSGDGDAMGIAMAHIPGLVEVDGEVKPLIVFDMLMRIHAPSGSEIMLSDMRKILYRLKRDLRFDLRMVTFDGFQSTDSIQLLRKQRITTDYLSVDRSKQPYEDLREGIYEERVLFPRYLTALNEVDVDLVNIAYRELTQLTDVGLKIDHPPKGSKDVADAMAGCVSLLMQMPQWSRGAPILKTDASGEMRSTEVDSDTPGEIAAQVFKGKKGSPHAHERAVTFSEFLASRDARDPGMRPVDDEKDDLPFIGGPVSVPASPFGGIA